VLDTTIHKTEDEDKQNKKHNNLCWTPPYTGQKTKTNKTKTQQHVLDTTIHRTEDEDKQNKKHNTTCVKHHHTQDRRRRQTKQKHNNMCCTPP